MAASTINDIKQTYRTIIFEEFNKEHTSLDTLIQRRDLLDDPDEMQKAVATGLEVHSFEEFLAKFKPCLYEVMEMVDGKPRLTYYTQKPNGEGYPVIEIKDTRYFKMLVSIYQNKGTANMANIDFDMKQFMELMMPKKDIEEIQDESKLLKSIEATILEKQAQRLDCSTLIAQKNSIRINIIKKYKNNKTRLLPMAVYDIDNKLSSLRTMPAQNASASGTVQLQQGVFGFDGEGMPIILPLPAPTTINNEKSDNKALVVSENTNLPTKIEPTEFVEKPRNEKDAIVVARIADYLAKDFDKNMDDKTDGNQFVKNLVVSLYSGKMVQNSPINKTEDTLKEQREIMMNLYTETQQHLIDAISELVSKVMEVKVFFDHATIEGGEKGCLEYPVLITNCKVSALLGKNKDNFISYIKSKENEHDENRFWFAVIPNVIDNNSVSYPVSDDGIRLSDEDEQESTRTNTYFTTISLVKELQPILEKAGITTVFNVKASSETGFSALNGSKIQEYRQFVDGINTPFAVFAYPNFTLLGERGIDIEEDTNPNKNIINFPGAYIGAAYVAAGLLVASQQPKYLANKGLKVEYSNVCNRVDLEDESINGYLVTKFNRERNHNLDSDTIKAISEDNFGFVFFSDKKKVPDLGYYKNSYVYLSRNLSKRDDTKKYEPIFRNLMRSFLNHYIALYQNSIDTLINGPIRDWNTESDNPEKKDVVNLILREGEFIDYDRKEKILNVKMNKENDSMGITVKDK